ncbi:hypothetical protein EMCRGX_G003379 [Ephydatia muelleri]
MDNQPPPQQAVAVVMDNRGHFYSGNTNTLTHGGNYPRNWLMCPITFLLLSSIVPLWYLGDDLELVKQLVEDELLEINGNSTEGMGHADAFTIIKHKGDIVKLTVRRLPESLSGYLELVKQQQLVSAPCSVMGWCGVVCAVMWCGVWNVFLPNGGCVYTDHSHHPLGPLSVYLCKMDNQTPPQEAVAMVMDNRGCSYYGNTNTLT